MELVKFHGTFGGECNGRVGGPVRTAQDPDMSERYQVRGRIGKGGMSAVYRGYDTVMGREVALKRLLPVEETNLNEAAAESLAREAAALSRFQHPNVITVFAFEQDAEGPYVIMELVEGKDLHAVVKSGTLSWEDFRDVAGQCLEPLVAAGELNLLHRDIKPGNIMLMTTPSDRFLVKLLDFGLAKFSQRPSRQTLDQQGSFLGSIEFIAPEQLELRPLDQRTDLYSLGCVFYYMLVGKSPFAGENPAETATNHVRHRCTPVGELRDDLPPLVADWIMRLISRHPEDRPSDARDALKQFRDALEGIPYVAPSLFDDGGDGPEAGRGEERPSAGPKPLLVPAAGSRPSAGANRGAGPGGVPEEPAAEGIPPLRIAAVGGGALVGFLAFLWLLWGERSEERAGLRPPKARAGAGPVEPDAPAYPSRLPPLGDADLPFVSVHDGLFAHFAASHGLYGRDHRSAPADGEPVAAWANLAAEEMQRSLLRDGSDAEGRHLPRYRLYGPTEVPGLRAAVPGLATTNRSALTMLKHQGVLPRGFTLVAAMRLVAGEDQLFRVQPPVPDGRSVVLVTEREGRVAAVSRGRAEGPETRLSIPWPDGSPGVLAYRWNPDHREHRLLSRPAGSARGAAAKGEIEFEGAAFGQVAIGKGDFDAAEEAPSGNVWFEFLVYDRLLRGAELEQVMAELAERYFGTPSEQAES